MKVSNSSALKRHCEWSAPTVEQWDTCQPFLSSVSIASSINYVTTHSFHNNFSFLGWFLNQNETVEDNGFVSFSYGITTEFTILSQTTSETRSKCYRQQHPKIPDKCGNMWTPLSLGLCSAYVIQEDGLGHILYCVAGIGQSHSSRQTSKLSQLFVVVVENWEAFLGSFVTFQASMPDYKENRQFIK